MALNNTESDLMIDKMTKIPLNIHIYSFFKINTDSQSGSVHVLGGVSEDYWAVLKAERGEP